MIRCFVLGFTSGGAHVAILTYLRDTSTSTGASYAVSLPIGNTDTAVTIQAAMEPAVQAKATLDGIGTINEFVWMTTLSSGTRSFTTPSRSLDSAFQISTTRDASVAYTVQVVSNLSLSGGQLGSVVLEYADDSGMSTNLVTVSEMGGGNTGTLTLGLNTNDTTKTALTGEIPAGKYVRLRSVDTTGTPVQTVVRSQEVLL